MLFVLPLFMYAQTSGGQIIRQSKRMSQHSSQNNHVNSSKRNVVKISDPGGYVNGHGFVDLGLSVKWATCNVGASSPNMCGDYFAWGEINTKQSFTKANYEFSILNPDVLELENDVANVIWGNGWRIPTENEFQELCNKCRWKWTQHNGVSGYRVTGKNGNAIFLPATGFYNSDYKLEVIEKGERGYYWASTIEKDDSNCACFLQFLEGFYRTYYMWRQFGFCVRPVFYQ